MTAIWRMASGMDATNDEELVRRSHTGCPRATEHLLSRYRPLVESKARTYYLRGADHEDVVQEGMIGLFKAIRDFRDDRLAHFRAFADLCVTRQIITAIKTASRQKHVPLNAYVSLHQTATIETETPLLEALPDTHLDSNPEESLSHRGDPDGRLDAVRHALSALETRVLDCYLQGKSYREMSAELDCPPKAVDNALQRVKRKINELRVPA
jgi:RNA polymerase sporulation-specific sigma factor